jgi:hypothetical protein
MFDYVKCVDGFMTLVCCVYDLIYYKMMTIVVYDMQSKYMNVQCVMWP